MIEELWRELTAPWSRLASISKGAIGRELRWGGIVRPLVVLVEMLLKPCLCYAISRPHSRQREKPPFNGKRAAGASTCRAIQRSRGGSFFTISTTMKKPSQHTSPSHYLRFATSIDIHIDQRAIRRLAFCSEMATAEGIA